MNKRKFYPMLTSTLQSTLMNIEPELLLDYILMIINYPDVDGSKVNMKDIATHVILTELDRQYARWNKGESNGTR